MTFTYPPLRNVQINVIKYVDLAPGTRFEIGVIPRNRYALVWAVDGPESLVARVDRRPLPLPTGTLLLLRPGFDWALENRGDGTRPATIAELWFDVRLPAHGWPPPESWPLQVVMAAESAFFPLFRFALTLAFCEEPERTAFVQQAFPMLLMMALTGRHTQFQPELTGSLPEPLERVWQIVHQAGIASGEPPPRLPELARRAGVSAGHLTRLFQLSFGVSPREFMLRQRLDRAASMLAVSPLGIKEIARMTGFYDQFHFSRQFRTQFGCTPRKYRDLPAAQRPVVKALERVQRAIPEELQIPCYASADLMQRAGGTKATLARLRRELRHEQTANRSPFAFPVHLRRRWRPLPLAQFANRSRLGGVEEWFGPGTAAPHLPPGPLQAHGIPFVLPDESSTGGRSIILLRSARTTGTPLPASVALPIPGRVAGIGLLHACGWTHSRRMRLGNYEIQYADHRHLSLPVMTWGGPQSEAANADLKASGPMLQDYWPDNPQFDSPTSRKFVVTDPEHPLTSIRYLYVFWWENPRPEVPILRLVLRGQPEAPGILAVLGVTLLAAPARKAAKRKP